MKQTDLGSWFDKFNDSFSTWQRRLVPFIFIIMLFVGIIGAILSLFHAKPDINQSNASADSSSFVLQTRRISELTASLHDLDKRVTNIPSSALSDAAIATKLAQISSIQADLADLKQILVANPTNSLALPMMRKDINDIQTRQAEIAASTKDLSASIKDQIDRIYDFSKWFLALMITLAVGLVTLGFVRVPKPS